MFPLGLCYRVLPDAANWRSVHRALMASAGLSEKLVSLLDAIDAGNWLRYNPRMRDLQALPDLHLAPRVLFLAAAYDPHSDPGRSKQKIEEIAAINDTRAQPVLDQGLQAVPGSGQRADEEAQLHPPPEILSDLHSHDRPAWLDRVEIRRVCCAVESDRVRKAELPGARRSAAHPQSLSAIAHGRQGASAPFFWRRTLSSPYGGCMRRSKGSEP